MKILKIPTFWTADQADTIYEFLGELQAAVWQEYHKDIQRLYEKVRDNQVSTNDVKDLDDEVEL